MPESRRMALCEADAFGFHGREGLFVPVAVHIRDAVLEDGDAETGLQEVFGCVPDAVFRGDAAHMPHT